jgi:hypothetical protein
VHFVARTPPAAIRATFRTSAVHFVARTARAAIRATFVPYSQHFVARTTTAATIATKRWLPSLPTQPQLTFATTFKRA